MRINAAWFVLASILLFTASSVRAQTGEATEKPLLTVTGKIDAYRPASIDLKTLMSLPSVSFRSYDPWDGREHLFVGVTLKDVMTHVGIQPDAATLTLTARNQYTIPILRKDYEKYEYLICHTLDGKSLENDPAMKKRGPLMVAINFTKHAGLQMEIYKHQLIWQLAEIRVE